MTDNQLVLATTEQFGNISTNIYKDENNDMFMTARQLGECLGFADPVRAVSKVTDRNNYLKTDEFSTVVKLTTLDGKSRNIRVFNEDGIYEITFLANTEKAKEFRTWVRRVIKSLRKGDIQLTQNNLSLTPQMIEQIIDNKLGLYFAKTEERLTRLIKSINTTDNNTLDNKEEFSFTPKESAKSVFDFISRVTESPLKATEKPSEPLYKPNKYSYLTDIIMPLAEKYNDHSKGYNATYQKVYKQMGCNFKILLGRYRNSHKLKHNPCKRKLISERPDLERRFTKAVEELLNT